MKHAFQLCVKITVHARGSTFEPRGGPVVPSYHTTFERPLPTLFYNINGTACPGFWNLTARLTQLARCDVPRVSAPPR